MCGVHVLCVCVCVRVCVLGGGVDAGEDEKERRSAQYICAHYILLCIIWSHLQNVYLVFCMLYFVYSCSSWVVCLPCIYYQFLLYICKFDCKQQNC